MPGSNNENIKFELLNEEIEILKKNHKNVEKGHTRSVGVTRSLDQPTILLSKAGKVREKVTFVDVKQINSGQSTNLIQLVCSNSEHVILRMKSRYSLERWLDFLKKCLPQENVYENPHRQRSSTMDQDLRGQMRRTPRQNNNPQSEYYPDATVLPQPMPVQELLETLPEDGYEVPNTFQSLRSTEPASSCWSVDQPALQDDEHTGAAHNRYHISVNIEVQSRSAQSSTRPTPPPRTTSHNGGGNMGKRSTSMHHLGLPTISNGNGDLMRELSSAVVRNSVKRRQDSALPEFPANSRPAGSRPLPLYLPDRQGDDKEEEEIVYDNAPSCVNSGIAAAAPRKPAPRNRPAPAVRHQSSMPNNTGGNQTTTTDSSSDEDEKSPYVNIQPTVYLTKLRQDLRSEMEQESVCQTVEKSSLQDLQITATSSGPCISRVPELLKRLFYHGDQIIDINDQTIINADFARSIIETSRNSMVKVTVKRLVRGHFVEFKRLTEGDPLGFSLKNGPEITSIKPGTVFAREAHCAMMERMAITHINGQYIPLDSCKQHVNMSIRNAGFNFFIVLQPVEFLKELMETSQ